MSRSDLSDAETGSRQKNDEENVSRNTRPQQRTRQSLFSRGQREEDGGQNAVEEHAARCRRRRETTLRPARDREADQGAAGDPRHHGAGARSLGAEQGSDDE